MENKVKVPLEFDPKYYSGVFNNHTKILGFSPRYENGYFECKDFNADPYLEQIVHLGEVKEWNLRLYRFGHSTRFDRVCHDYQYHIILPLVEKWDLNMEGRILIANATAGHFINFGRLITNIEVCDSYTPSNHFIILDRVCYRKITAPNRHYKGVLPILEIKI